MKKMNRREFLTLTGAAVVALSLAGCGAPSAPPAAPTGKEAKVLEAINKYRGALPPLTPDSGLDPAMEIVMKLTKGEMKFDEEAMKALAKAEAGYDGVCAPIGIAFDKDTGNMMPVCVYSENAELMAQNLSLQVDEDTQERLKSASLIAIQVFEYGGGKYWVALVAKGKVTP